MDRRVFLQNLSISLGALLFAPGSKPTRDQKPSKSVPYRSWGYSAGGQLDQSIPPSATDFADPAPTLHSGWSALAGGTNWWLGLKDGVPYHWGQNDRGQRGDGTTNSTATIDKPPQAMALTGITQIAATDDAALMLNGTTGDLYGTGHRFDLGIAAGIGNQLTPTLVLTNVAMVAAGSHFAIAVLTNNQVWFTGDGYVRGDGTFVASPGVWLQIAGLTGPYAQIAAGLTHAIFRPAVGNCYGLGQNGSGELGLGTTTGTYVATDLGTPAEYVAAGADNSLWIISSVLYFTGDNSTGGQNGQGGGTSPASETTRVTITLPGSRTPRKAFIARETAGAGVLATDGSWSAWGRNSSGWFGSQTITTIPGLPDNTVRSTPVLCETGPFADVSAGDFSIFTRTGARAFVAVIGL